MILNRFQILKQNHPNQNAMRLLQLYATGTNVCYYFKTFSFNEYSLLSILGKAFLSFLYISVQHITTNQGQLLKAPGSTYAATTSLETRNVRLHKFTRRQPKSRSTCLSLNPMAFKNDCFSYFTSSWIDFSRGQNIVLDFHSIATDTKQKAKEINVLALCQSRD